MENIEHDILKAAQEVFLEKGYANATTTEIARRAGCQQSLVHYYYRTKERLFQEVFIMLINKVLQQIFSKVNNDNLDFKDKLHGTINMYFDMLNDNRQLPFLIINELVLNPERRNYIRESMIHNPMRISTYMQFTNTIEKAKQMELINDIEPFDLLIDIVSLTASTFLSLPIYTGLLEKTPEQVEEYIAHRKAETIQLIDARLGL